MRLFTKSARYSAAIFLTFCSLIAVNMASHGVASHSEGPMSVVWHEDPPDFLVNALADDVSVLNA